jgi:RNA polymerase sigma-70 factor (ECF subfamily)
MIAAGVGQCHRSVFAGPSAVGVGSPHFAVSCTGRDEAGVGTLRREEALNRFLAEIEKRALRIAEIAVRDRDEALDLVQDAMIGLVRRYSRRPPEEWRPLFYRILKNGVRDWHRRRSVRRRVFAWFGAAAGDEPAVDPIALTADPSRRTPDVELESREAMASLEEALRRLPARQREAFMLRAFEGLDVAGTAAAMGVSQGSVKTHYSRAVHALRDSLGQHRE